MSITDQFDQLSGITARSISDLKALRNASLDNAYSKLQQELSSHYTSLENVASDVSHTSSAALTLVNSVKSTYEGVKKALNKIKQRKLEKQDDEADEEEADQPENENLEDEGYEADLEDFDDYDFVEDFGRNNAFLGAADETEADATFEQLPQTENFWNANVDNLADFDDQPVLMTRANPADPDQYRVVLRKSDDPLETQRQIEEEDRLFEENQRQAAPEEEETEFEISPEELEGPISLDDKPSTIDTAEAQAETEPTEPASSEFETATEGELEPESAEAETQPIESDVAAVSTEAETEATPNLLEGAEVELTQLGGEEALGEIGGEIAGEAGAEIGGEVAAEAATALIGQSLDWVPVAGQILGAASLIGAVAGGIGTAYSIGQEYSSKLSAAQEQLKEEKAKPVDIGGQFAVGSLSSVNQFRQ